MKRENGKLSTAPTNERASMREPDPEPREPTEITVEDWADYCSAEER